MYELSVTIHILYAWNGNMGMDNGSAQRNLHSGWRKFTDRNFFFEMDILICQHLKKATNVTLSKFLSSKSYTVHEPGSFISGSMAK